MAFTKRRKQPHLFRNPAVDPTKQVRAQLAAAAEVAAVEPSAPTSVVAKRKTARKKKSAKR